jgi:hypothetical protein
MTKALAKFTSWAVVFVPRALGDPAGTSTVSAVTSGAHSPPEALLSLPAVAAVGVTLVLGALVLAFREARLADPIRRSP